MKNYQIKSTALQMNPNLIKDILKERIHWLGQKTRVLFLGFRKGITKQKNVLSDDPLNALDEQGEAADEGG